MEDYTWRTEDQRTAPTGLEEGKDCTWRSEDKRTASSRTGGWRGLHRKDRGQEDSLQ